MEMVTDVLKDLEKVINMHKGLNLNQGSFVNLTTVFGGELHVWTFQNSKAVIQRIGYFKLNNILIVKVQRKMQKSRWQAFTSKERHCIGIDR